MFDLSFAAAAGSPTARLLPALLVPIFAWRIYRRFQRNVGRQPLRRGRLITGIAVFSFITLLLIVGVVWMPSLSLGLAGGLSLGCGLAFVGLHLTHFDTTDAGHCYTPNTYLGVALSLLLTGRLVYRFGVYYNAGAEMQSFTLGRGAPFLGSSLTVFIFALTAGYYITYNSGVLIRGGKQRPGDVS